MLLSKATYDEYICQKKEKQQLSTTVRTVELCSKCQALTRTGDRRETGLPSLNPSGKPVFVNYRYILAMLNY